MKIPASAALAAATLAFLAARASAPRQGVAPHLTAGSSVYGLVLPQTATPGLPELGPVEPVKIIGVQGRWALVEARGQTRGPVWINFDQVVSYRTDR